MKVPPETHPIWRIITLVTCFSGCTFFLWMNASNFDHTEWKSIIEIVASLTGYEFIKSQIAGKG